MHYFKHAKSNCCNFQQTVIHNKDCVRINYCWLQSRTCDLHPDIDMGCFYYVNAVLPSNKLLQKQWLAENPPMGSFIPVATKVKKAPPEPKKVQSIGYKVCDCGKGFDITSNRQTSCPECQQLRNQETAKARLKRHRNNNLKPDSETV